ncbi:MAG: ADP-forming succinate--CoA ligase subunit beta [Myxococcales bacterium]|nr:ADP-forming succinate--CoA ligase subunit beta [Myxococcota bacterium]MDW8282944.1 ADP-forming succinate--CoA ligase subunit beta [Myxococcales bacterium]
MNIHEYQGKQLLSRFGVPVPIGKPAFDLTSAQAAIEQVQAQSGREEVVVKAQIHAGGRGKGGGVVVARDGAAARQAAERLLGMRLVTHQTGPEGRIVKRLLIEQGMDIEREMYVAVVLDRQVGRVAVMASTEGGMDIEEVARSSPEKIVRQHVDPAVGFRSWQARQLCLGLDLLRHGPAIFQQGIKLLSQLVLAFHAMDCSLVEINPLVLTRQGQLVCLDAKLNFDDNALYRHPDIEDLRDLDEEEPAETEARKHDLSYIKLSGDIGCMVNGAGLAMATMDIIRHYGGMPANFLDVGGGASQDKVTAAFKIITRDPAVRGIFINIFGGIMKCDTIAEGVLAAVREVGLSVPLVVRLEGTNVALGKRILDESGLNIVSASDMADGARKILALVRGAQAA